MHVVGLQHLGDAHAGLGLEVEVEVQVEIEVRADGIAEGADERFDVPQQPVGHVFVVGAHRAIEAAVPGRRFARHDDVGLQGREATRHDLFAQGCDVIPGLDWRCA